MSIITLLSAKYKILSLTHKILLSIPTWPTISNIEITYNATHEKEGVCAMVYKCSASLGTHIDAPYHFVNGGRTIDKLRLNELLSPACVIDIRPQVQQNEDYTLTVNDILKWEAEHGKISEGNIVLICTGWSSRWPNVESYRNMDAQGIMHFPGVSIEAAQLLLERNVVGLGIDTFSPDAGIATTFPVHNLMLNKDKIFIENLTSVEQLPATGAFIIALPLNIEGGAEAPAHVIALIN